MMHHLPAVVVGGPPHSGKSVLVHRLTFALKQRGIAHYVLRACPDGEGNWFLEGGSNVHTFRYKGQFSDDFVQFVVSLIEDRQLPLIVDMGGKPTAEQEAIAEACTHGLLVIREDAEGDVKNFWHRLLEKYGVKLVASFESTLDPDQRYFSSAPLIQGKLCWLERDAKTFDPNIDLLIDHLESILTWRDTDLAATQREALPAEVRLLHLQEIVKEFGRSDAMWEPEDLQKLKDIVLEYGDSPMAIFGSGPIWVTGLLAIEAPLQYIFNAHLGWIPFLSSRITVQDRDETVFFEWLFERKSQEGYQIINLNRGQASDHFLVNPEDVEEIYLPQTNDDSPLIISGAFPFWLLAPIVRELARRHDEIWAYQPNINGIVCVKADDASRIGMCLPFLPK